MVTGWEAAPGLWPVWHPVGGDCGWEHGPVRLAADIDKGVRFKLPYFHVGSRVLIRLESRALARPGPFQYRYRRRYRIRRLLILLQLEALDLDFAEPQRPTRSRAMARRIGCSPMDQEAPITQAGAVYGLDMPYSGSVARMQGLAKREGADVRRAKYSPGLLSGALVANVGDHRTKGGYP